MKLSRLFLLLGCVLAIPPAFSKETPKEASSVREPAIAGLTQRDLDLFQAVDNSDLKTMKKLIAQGANVNARRRPWNMSMLLFAVEKDVAVAKLLVAAGADVNAADRDDATVLMKAVQEGKLDLVKLLLANGAKTEERDHFDETALVYAVVHGHTDIIKALIQAGANVNFVRYDGKTILVLANGIVASAKDMKFKELMRHGPEHQHNHETGHDHGRGHDHGKQESPAKKESTPNPDATISSASYNKNSGLTPHKRYVKNQLSHESEMVSKEQIIKERQEIVAILKAAGAEAKESKPRVPKKKHH